MWVWIWTEGWKKPGSSLHHSNGSSSLRGLAEHPSARLPGHEFPPGRSQGSREGKKPGKSQKTLTGQLNLPHSHCVRTLIIRNSCFLALSNLRVDRGASESRAMLSALLSTPSGFLMVRTRLRLEWFLSARSAPRPARLFRKQRRMNGFVPPPLVAGSDSPDYRVDGSDSPVRSLPSPASRCMRGSVPGDSPIGFRSARTSKYFMHYHCCYSHTFLSQCYVEGP